MAENQGGGGKDQHKQQALFGKVRIQFFPGQQDQRNVDDQREIANADMEQILNNGGKTIDAGRSKGIGKDKQGIAQPHHQSQPCYHTITAPVIGYWTRDNGSPLCVARRSIPAFYVKYKSNCKLFFVLQEYLHILQN